MSAGARADGALSDVEGVLLEGSRLEQPAASKRAGRKVAAVLGAALAAGLLAAASHGAATLDGRRAGRWASVGAAASLADSPVCGTKGADATPLQGKAIGRRVVNGQEASPCEYPWMGLVHFQSNVAAQCAATLISRRWALTSASCARIAGSPADFQVHLGAFNAVQAREGSDPSVQTVGVARVVLHPDYQSNQDAFNIALLELAEEASLGRCIGVACLPTSDVSEGGVCVLAGWGRVQTDEDNAEELQEGEVAVTTDSRCEAAYSDIFPDGLPAGVLCAQGLSATRPVDFCIGDRGAPLMCDGGDGHYAVHGVTSFLSYPCAQRQYPGGYVRVFHVVDWIRETIGGGD